MGACSRIVTIDATSGKEAFQIIYDEDLIEYGEDSYNGSFSTTHYIGPYRGVDLSNKDFSKSTEEIAMAARDNILERTSKWEATTVNMGIVGYRATKNVIKSTKLKLETRYVLENSKTGKTYLLNAKTTTDAKKSLEGNINEYDTVKKVYIDPSNKSKTGVLFEKETITKTYKKRPKTVPKGFKLETIYKFMVIGWCAC